MTVISNPNEKAPEVNVKTVIKGDQEETITSEFQVWLKKLKSNVELKNKFLSQMGIIKKEEQPFIESDDCIEISDSDEDWPSELNRIQQHRNDMKKVHATMQSLSASTLPKSPSSKEITKITPPENITKNTLPHIIEIAPNPPVRPILKKSSPKLSLSKLDYIPAIALPYVPVTRVSEEEYRHNKGDIKNSIYGPELEPISPVGNEHNFTYPEVTTTSKMLPLPITFELEESRVVLSESITSPLYNQKRKTSLDLANESISPNRTFTGNASKRRMPLDRPQRISPRVVPSGKLCYVRENHVFLRYFDDTQVELFIKNLSVQDDELLKTTGIDPKKVNKSHKQSNSHLEEIRMTEVIHLPGDIEFSRKEDLPDVEEFVKETSLVQRFVPKDFADFYRYVTGFQIIKNKHPVSLQTFLTMYNTNRTRELLRKYLQLRDDDS